MVENFFKPVSRTINLLCQTRLRSISHEFGERLVEKHLPVDDEFLPENNLVMKNNSIFDLEFFDRSGKGNVTNNHTNTNLITTNHFVKNVITKKIINCTNVTIIKEAPIDSKGMAGWDWLSNIVSYNQRFPGLIQKASLFLFEQSEKEITSRILRQPAMTSFMRAAHVYKDFLKAVESRFDFFRLKTERSLIYKFYAEGLRTDTILERPAAIKTAGQKEYTYSEGAVKEKNNQSELTRNEMRLYETGEIKRLETRLDEITKNINIDYLYDRIYEKMERRLWSERRRRGM